MRHASALAMLETTVVSDWVDYNGHMNDAAYAIVFSSSVDALMDRVGLDAAARKRSGQTLFTLQMMLHYFKEAKEGDALVVTCQLLEHDDKRMRVWLDMATPGGERLAASEQLLISVAQADGSSRAVSLELRNQGRARSARQGAKRPAPSARSRIRRGLEATLRGSARCCFRRRRIAAKARGAPCSSDGLSRAGATRRRSETVAGSSGARQARHVSKLRVALAIGAAMRGGAAVPERAEIARIASRPAARSLRQVDNGQLSVDRLLVGEIGGVRHPAFGDRKGNRVRLNVVHFRLGKVRKRLRLRARTTQVL